MIRNLLVFCLCFLPQLSTAQSINSGMVKGKLVDNKNQPIPYATITVQKADNTVVTGDLSADDGNFQIKNIPLGQYRLSINALGFGEKKLENIKVTSTDVPMNIGTIKMTGTTETLNEVAITAERKQMEMSIDKKVFNVDKNITSTGGSAADVLQNVPSVSVSTDGDISLRGKSGVTLLIDGKPSTLLGTDVASALQALPAASIDNVEVITNPSAKYDAQGMTGIINIVTKKDKKVGLNGMVTLGAGTREKYNGGINLNLRNNKFNLFFNSSYRNNRNGHEQELYRENRLNGSSFISKEDGYRRFSGWFNTIGADFYLNKNHTITLTQNVNRMRFGGASSTRLNNYNPNDIIDSSMFRTNERDGGPNSYGTALAHKWKFNDPKKELNTAANFNYSDQQMEQEMNTEYYNYSGRPYYGIVKQKTPGGGDNKNWMIQSDYSTNLFKEDDRFETGIKYQGWSFRSSNNPTIESPNESTRVDSTLLNNFKYQQQVFAAYINYGATKGKFSYQAGLRAEQAQYNGTVQVGQNVSYKNTFLSLFPSAYLSYQLDKTQQVYLNYTRRTNRPDFRSLMPFLDISNPQDMRQGNPNLKPEFINNFELNYSKSFPKGHSLMASFYTQYTTNMIDRFRYFNSDGTSISIPANLNSGLTNGLELIGRAQLLPIWDMMLNVNAFRNQINSSNIASGFNKTGYGWFAKLNTTVKLPAKFSFQLMGNYESAKINSQSVNKEIYWVDVALKKSLLNNKASLTLNVTDIFDTRKRTLEFDMPEYYQSNYYNRETRIGTLTFTYNFGKSDMKGARKGGKPDNKGVKDRDNLRSEEGDSGM